MKATLIDGKKIAAEIEDKVAKKIKILRGKGFVPTLAVILVGNNKASLTYVKKKEEAARRAGIDFELFHIADNVKTDDLIQIIQKIQRNKNVCGLIVQLPLPEHFYISQVLNAINPEIDVDCLTDVNLGKLVMKTHFIVPPTPGAALTILKTVNEKIEGSNVTIVGTGALVGKPFAIMMMNEGASVTTINSRTKDNNKKCRKADIIITGVGKKDVIRGNMVKRGAIVIDAGVAFKDGKMYGDVNIKEVTKKAKFLTPTPGGVGPITVARLLLNTAICAEKKFTDK